MFDNSGSYNSVQFKHEQRISLRSIWILSLFCVSDSLLYLDYVFILISSAIFLSFSSRSFCVCKGIRIQKELTRTHTISRSSSHAANNVSSALKTDWLAGNALYNHSVQIRFHLSFSGYRQSLHNNTACSRIRKSSFRSLSTHNSLSSSSQSTLYNVFN
jgi:hypothetical protein